MLLATFNCSYCSLKWLCQIYHLIIEHFMASCLIISRCWSRNATANVILALHLPSTAAYLGFASGWAASWTPRAEGEFRKSHERFCTRLNDPVKHVNVLSVMSTCWNYDYENRILIEIRPGYIFLKKDKHKNTSTAGVKILIKICFNVHVYEQRSIILSTIRDVHAYCRSDYKYDSNGSNGECHDRHQNCMIT